MRIDDGGGVTRTTENNRTTNLPVRTVTATPTVINVDAKRADVNYLASTNKRKLETQLVPTAAISVYDAQARIDKLPPPDRTNPNSIKAYNEQRAQIAEEALKYATPPRIEDFRRSGLNGRTAEFEYTEARAGYDRTVQRLRDAVALRESTSLLTPEAEAAAKASADKIAKQIEDNPYDPKKNFENVATEINVLKAQYGDEAAARMMAELYKKDPTGLMLNLSHADDISSYDKQTIGQALGDAYGYLSPEQKAEFAKLVAEVTVGDAFTPRSSLEQKSTTLAEILASSTNTQMKTDVVKALMDKAATIQKKIFGDNGGVDVQALFKSAAMIANTAPPTERAAMLKNIVETLPKINLPSLIKDNETKDLLSQLFMNSGPEFMHLVAPDGAISSSTTRDGIIKLMELTLFSEGANSERPKMMEYMVKLMKDVGDAAVQPPTSQSAYEAAHGGWSQQDHVEAMSSLFAMTWKAAQNQKEAIKADQEQQKKTAEMFTGLAFSFVPGAGKVLGEIGGEGASYLEKIGGKVRDFAWDQSKDALKSGVNSQLADLISGDSLKDIDKTLSALRDTVLSINSSLPNGEAGELDLRAKFQAAFSFYQLI